LWEVAQSYRKQSPLPSPIVNVPLPKVPSRIRRKSVPKLPLTGAHKQQDVVDGPNSDECSSSSSPSHRHAIRSEWLSDSSAHLSFDYTKSQIRHSNGNTLPSASSTTNSMNNVQATSNGSKEHMPKIVYHKSLQARIARNYYKLQHTTLFVAFCINLLLLSAKVSL